MVGIINTALTFLVFSGMFRLTGSRIVSLAVDYLFGLLFSYVMNGIFTFKADMGNHRKQLPRMVLTYAVLGVANYFMLIGLTDYLHFNTYLAQFLTVGVIAVSSYGAQKLFVFRNRR